jgi:hypothetical protein
MTSTKPNQTHLWQNVFNDEKQIIGFFGKNAAYAQLRQTCEYFVCISLMPNIKYNAVFGSVKDIMQGN